MDNIIIGIVGRTEEIDNNKFQVISENIIKHINNKSSYVGIINYDKNFIDTTVLSKCNGIIIQGGNDIFPFHFQIIEYALENNIPILGICMGHQIIGLYFNKQRESELIKIENHNNKDLLHKIRINNDSNLYKILGKEIYVNTRHNFALNSIKEPLKEVARSEDNIIEAIEYIDNDNYIVGVQWHPEDLSSMRGLFNDFVKHALLAKIKKENNK